VVAEVKYEITSAAISLCWDFWEIAKPHAFTTPDTGNAATATVPLLSWHLKKEEGRQMIV